MAAKSNNSYYNVQSLDNYIPVHFNEDKNYKLHNLLPKNFHCSKTEKNDETLISLGHEWQMKSLFNSLPRGHLNDESNDDESTPIVTSIFGESSTPIDDNDNILLNHTSRGNATTTSEHKSDACLQSSISAEQLVPDYLTQAANEINENKYACGDLSILYSVGENVASSIDRLKKHDTHFSVRSDTVLFSSCPNTNLYYHLKKKSKPGQVENELKNTSTSDILFYDDRSAEYSPMLNPMLCFFINQSSSNQLADRSTLNRNKIGNNMQRKQCSNSKYLSFETSLSSNRDSAVICDSDVLSDSQSGVGTLAHDDSYNEFQYPMTTSQTVDSLFMSAFLSSNRTMCERDTDNDNGDLTNGDSQITLCYDYSNTQTINKPLRPTQYCSLPIPPRTGLKRSPALDGVCDLLYKTDEELERIQKRVYLVNDDDLFPDSLTPTKADSSLRIEGSVYDIPYIDEEPFSGADLSIIHYQSIDTRPRIRLADCDECTLLSEEEIEQSPSRYQSENIQTAANKVHKRKSKWFRFCNCFSKSSN